MFGTYQDCSIYVNDELAMRECHASNGDKVSQYEMGFAAYQAGDIKTAKKWLSRSAYDEPKTLPIYSPPVGGEKSGTIIYVQRPMAMPGYYPAKELLKKIKNEDHK